MKELVNLKCANCGKTCGQLLKYYENGVVADEWCPQCGYLMEEVDSKE